MNGALMKPSPIVVLGITVMGLAWSICTTADQNAVTMLKWYRGNLHTHTLNSDGDSSPYDVIAWYKRNGYHFVAITDHNTFTDPEQFDSNLNDNFLVVGGEEITNDKAVHVNAIGIRRVIPAQPGSGITDILQASIHAIRAQGAVPLINHPNFRWALSADDMFQLKGAALLEISSGYPAANHAGNGHSPSTEEMWDQLLSAGIRIFAVAVDDVHNFRQEFTMERANPGRGWVVVRASALTREDIIAALDSGEFYASSGIELKGIQHTSDSLTVEIQTTASAQSPKRYRVVFIGKNGRSVAVTQENPARYRFAGDEGYVRARIEDSDGLRAWTQPVFIEIKP